MQGVPQWIRGTTSRQAHVGLPPGTVEEEHGRAGFYGAASHLYRLHPPTAWTSVEGPASHVAYDTNLLQGDDDLWPTLLLGNDQVSIAVHRYRRGRPEFLRDSDGDVLYFVHQGTGLLRTEYGPLRYREGDYLVVPRGTTHRFEVAGVTVLLVVEAFRSQYSLPDRGLLGRHALFDPAVIEVPEAEAVDEEGDFVVVVKRDGHDTTVHYPFHPCDVVGWKGDVAPMRLNVEDIRPVTSPRFHLPPSAHSTWVADGFVVCTFVPRPLEEDPDALRLPFFHRNVDYDEVIFYHRGEFFSRAGIGEGMVTFHPFGLHHGPQPGARERDARAAAAANGSADGGPVERRMANEYAVMIDARRPLGPGPDADRLQVADYVASWAEIASSSD
ncbi:MAG: homogentisate 1,2-dioxygenase [Acidimicrobiales bacterium]